MWADANANTARSLYPLGWELMPTSYPLPLFPPLCPLPAFSNPINSVHAFIPSTLYKLSLFTLLPSHSNGTSRHSHYKQQSVSHMQRFRSEVNHGTPDGRGGTQTGDSGRLTRARGRTAENMWGDSVSGVLALLAQCGGRGCLRCIIVRGEHRDTMLK
ncbi:uncharacterized protein K452DRAFT_289605 [Aplosporella prunicola CBS 121167]|uniref:Uncharacterized protein n=1 Tax=Aplosporella prunicola CBS 121167 TaxID=1176127 RepID=A0A6A6B8K7_9PEZI|nr:uncharacterized protein K452DRAFT_289605 [Aplosporella prunicola CBS 121167]KAF2139605.1 hypothetical protein K452DRAFT_289605 [Aplosporella prunicola CBS 121167]